MHYFFMSRFVLPTFIFLLLSGVFNICQAKEDKIENESSTFNIDFKLDLGGAYQKQFYFGNELDGLGSNDYTAAIGLSIDAEYYNFFLESNSKGRIGGVLGRTNIGYHLWRDDNSSIDIISANYIPAINREDSDDVVIPELRNLNKRNDDYSFGFRYSQVKNNWYFSSEIVNDILNSAHKGFVIDNYIGKTTSQGNWDLTYGFGHTWYSAKVSNYYVGLQQNEIVNDWSSYQTGASYTLNVGFFAEYPISKSWVFEGGFEYNWLSKNIRNSPLIVSDYSLSSFVGFGYVF